MSKIAEAIMAAAHAIAQRTRVVNRFVEKLAIFLFFLLVMTFRDDHKRYVRPQLMRRLLTQDDMIFFA